MLRESHVNLMQWHKKESKIKNEWQLDLYDKTEIHLEKGLLKDSFVTGWIMSTPIAVTPNSVMSYSNSNSLIIFKLMSYFDSNAQQTPAAALKYASHLRVYILWSMTPHLSVCVFAMAAAVYDLDQKPSWSADRLEISSFLERNCRQHQSKFIRLTGDMGRLRDALLCLRNMDHRQVKERQGWKYQWKMVEIPPAIQNKEEGSNTERANLLGKNMANFKLLSIY